MFFVQRSGIDVFCFALLIFASCELSCFAQETKLIPLGELPSQEPSSVRKTEFKQYTHTRVIRVTNLIHYPYAWTPPNEQLWEALRLRTKRLMVSEWRKTNKIDQALKTIEEWSQLVDFDDPESLADVTRLLESWSDLEASQNNFAKAAHLKRRLIRHLSKVSGEYQPIVQQLEVESQWLMLLEQASADVRQVFFNALGKAHPWGNKSSVLDLISVIEESFGSECRGAVDAKELAICTMLKSLDLDRLVREPAASLAAPQKQTIQEIIQMVKEHEALTGKLYGELSPRVGFTKLLHAISEYLQGNDESAIEYLEKAASLCDHDNVHACPIFFDSSRTLPFINCEKNAGRAEFVSACISLLADGYRARKLFQWEHRSRQINYAFLERSLGPEHWLTLRGKFTLYQASKRTDHTSEQILLAAKNQSLFETAFKKLQSKEVGYGVVEIDEWATNYSTLYGNDKYLESCRMEHSALLHYQTDPNKSLSQLLEAYNLRSAILGRESPDLNHPSDSIVAKINAIFRQHERSSQSHQESMEWTKKELDFRMSHYGPYHWHTFDCQLSLAVLNLKGVIPDAAYSILATPQNQFSEEMSQSMSSGRALHDRLAALIGAYGSIPSNLHDSPETRLIFLRKAIPLHDALGDFREAKSKSHELCRILKDCAMVHSMHADAITQLNQLTTETGEAFAMEVSGKAILDAIGWVDQEVSTTKQVAFTIENNPNSSAQIAKEFHRFKRAMQQEDFVLALTYAESLLEKARATFGNSSEEFAIALANLATANMSLGDFESAQSSFRKSLETLATSSTLAIRGPAVLQNLAIALTGMQEYDESIQCFSRSWELLNSNETTASSESAQLLMNWGMTLHRAGNSSLGLEKLESSIAIFESLNDVESLQFIEALNNAGRACITVGDLVAAERFLTRALELRIRLRFVETDGHADLLHNLAILAFEVKDYQLAERRIQESLTMSRRLLEGAAMIQSERQQIALSKAFRERVETYICFANEQHASPSDTYSNIFRWKGATLARSRNRIIADEESQKKFAELRAVQQRISSQAYQLLSRDDEIKLEELIKEKEVLERSCLDRLIRSVTLDETSISLEQLQRRLGDDEVLLDFFEYEPFSWKGKKERFHSRYGVFLVRRNEVLYVDIGSSKAINDLVTEWREKCHLPLELDSAHPGVHLRKRMWDSIAQHIRINEKIVVSPDGLLSKLPFAALPTQDSGRYLVQDHSVLTTIVPQLLVERYSETRSDTSPPMLLNLGCIDYGSPGGATDQVGQGPFPAWLLRSLRNWNRLPASEPEIYDVRSSFETAYPNGITLQLHSRRATKRRFLNQIPEFSYVHIATHGFNIEDQIAKDRSKRVDVSKFAPGILNGIVLSGANDWVPTNLDTESGLLTAFEISNLSLKGNKLVVLSACETSLGRMERGEGTIGLQRAFHAAGASNVMGSLWPVDDSATRFLMQNFYQNLWKQGLSKAEALRQAQCKMIEYNSAGEFPFYQDAVRGMKRVGAEVDKSRPLPPYFWAAFVLSGTDD